MATVQLAKLAAVTALDNAKAPKEDATLTGTTTVDAISPDIADLGTVAIGDVTLSTTKAVSRVVLSGTSATVVFPAGDPRVSQSLIVDSTSGSDTTVSMPSSWSMVRDTLITSFVLPAGLSTVLTWVHDGTQYIVSGDRQTVAQAKAALALSISDISGLSEAIAALAPLASPALTGTPTVPTASLGTNTTQAASTAFVLANSSSAVGYAAPVTVAAEDIDWALAYVFTKSLTDDTAFTFSGELDGKEIEVEVINPSSHTVTWPVGILWSGGSQPTQTVAGGGFSKTDIYRFRKSGTTIYGRREDANLFIDDTTSPVYVSSVINGAGTGLIDTYNEELSATVTTTTGRAITMSGGAVTVSSPVVSGVTVTWTLSRTIAYSETCSANAYTAPGTGVKDLSDNYAETYTGRQADLENESTDGIVAYLLEENFEGSNSDTQSNVGYDTSGVWASSASIEPRNTASPSSYAGTYSLKPGASNRLVVFTISGNPRSFSWAANIGTSYSTNSNFKLYTGWSNGTGTGTEVARIEITTGAKLRLYHGSASTASSASTYNQDQWRYWWMDYAPSTGADDGTLALYVSSDETKPGSPILSITAGTSTAEVNGWQVAGFGTNGAYDKLRAQATAIGSNPA